MLLNNGPVFNCQGFFLIKNIIRHANLSDVMKQRHIMEVLYFLLAPPKPSGNLHRTLSNPHGMSAGIFVLGINRICNRHDGIQSDHFYLLGFLFQLKLQIIFQLIQFQNPADSACHYHRHKRFGNKVVSPDLQAFGFRYRICICRQKDNRYPVPFAVCLDPAGRLHPIHLRHLNIHQNQIRRILLQHMQSFLTGSDTGNAIVLDKRMLSHHKIHMVIIYQKDMLHKKPPSFLYPLS